MNTLKGSRVTNRRNARPCCSPIRYELVVLAAVATSGAAVADDADASDNRDPWASLFDGKSLNGWFVKCRPEDSDKRGIGELKTEPSRLVASRKRSTITSGCSPTRSTKISTFA